MDVEELVARRHAELRPHLDERQRRLALGAEARAIGRGGIKLVARATGAHPDTVARGVRELEAGGELAGQVRAPGGGRKKLAEVDADLAPALMALVSPDTRGDPESPLLWTTKSTRHLAAALTGAGHACSAWVVARLLRAAGYSLQGNAKVTEGNQHADRDAQFRYINERVAEHLAAAQPVVSVDTKKRSWSASSRTGAANTSPPARRCRSTCTTSSTKTWARRSPTASTTWQPTPGGCRSGATTTPPPSPYTPCAAGGTPSARPATRTPTNC